MLLAVPGRQDAMLKLARAGVFDDELDRSNQLIEQAVQVSGN